jgi:hypothetical protein
LQPFNDNPRVRLQQLPQRLPSRNRKTLQERKKNGRKEEREKERQKNSPTVFMSYFRPLELTPLIDFHLTIITKRIMICFLFVCLFVCLFLLATCRTLLAFIQSFVFSLIGRLLLLRGQKNPLYKPFNQKECYVGNMAGEKNTEKTPHAKL